MTTQITIGEARNYIVDREGGSDIIIENGDSNGNIIMKLGSTTDTSMFIIDSETEGDVFQSRGDKSTLFRDEISIDMNNNPANHTRDFEFKANNDTNVSSVKAILHYDASTPTLSYSANVMYNHTSINVTDNTNKDYLSAWLLSGKIVRTCNTAVTDTLPTPSVLVAAISGVQTKSSFCFSIQNNNTRETSTAGHFITIATGSGITWDKNTSESAEYIVPGQLSTYRIRITNETSSIETYTIELIGTQGERKSDHAIRYFSNIDSPITGTTLTTGTLTDIPGIIGQANFVRDYPSYTFFQNSGTNEHIVNLGPPCNVSIFARVFMDHESGSDRIFEFNILKNGTEIWVNGAIRVVLTNDDPGPFVAVNYPIVPLATNDTISASVKLISATSSDIRIYSCQLTVYQIS